MNSRIRIAIVVAALLVAAFIIFAALTPAFPLRDGIVGVDQNVLRLVVDHRTNWAIKLMEWVSELGDWWASVVVVTLGTGALFARRFYREGIFLLISAIGGYVLSTSVKAWVGRARPEESFRALVIDSPAFPSGHTWHAVTIYGALALLLWHIRGRSMTRRIVAVAVSLMAFLGFSRIYLAVHWTSDVVGGWLLGVAWLVICWACLLAGHPSFRSSKSAVGSAGEPLRR